MSKQITHQHYDDTKTTGSHYRCVGNVSGWCGVKHRVEAAAVACQNSSINDRSIYLYDDEGNRQGLSECHAIVGN